MIEAHNHDARGGKRHCGTQKKRRLVVKRIHKKYTHHKVGPKKSKASSRWRNLRTTTHAIKTVIFKNKTIKEDDWWRGLNYSDYLKTKHWRRTKRQFFLWLSHRSEDGKLYCENCENEMTKSNRKQFHVHHKSYDSLGHERMDHLSLLCSDCHHKTHEQT